MKRSSYREQDYAFGQLMLTLRTRVGLTQAGLADLTGVSRRAVGEWEGGLAYPKNDHFKAFLALCVRQQAFPAGREAEEIRALWNAAHQNVLLDELWLQGLLSKPPSPRVSTVTQARGVEVVSTPLAGHGSRFNWGDALDVPSFYGREGELATLARWVVQEHCRVVSVLGLGGIGKSALTVSFMHQVASDFEIVLWRSLRDAPTWEALLDDCLQVLAPEMLRDATVSLERRFSLLLECTRRTHVLLVLDNLETLLDEGQSTGHLRPGYEGYARLLQLMAETEHQSCLLLTSREKPVDLVPPEGNRVRALRVARLDDDACQQLLADKDVAGSAADSERLIEAYEGNPLALNIISQTIVDLFGGEIAPFLEQGELVFGGVRDLLTEQFDRISAIEQRVLHWLSIVRQPVTLGELRALLVMPKPSRELLEAIYRLRQRSLIEHGQRPGSFTLQRLVSEYVTMRLGGERRNRAGTACEPDPAWTLSGSRQGIYTADLGVAAGSRSGMFSAYPLEAYSGGRAVTLAARPTA